MGKEYGLRSKKVSLTADFFASSPSAGISLRPHAAATISIKSAIMQHPGRLIVNPAAITDIQIGFGDTVRIHAGKGRDAERCAQQGLPVQ